LTAKPSSASAQSDDPTLKALEQATNRLALAEETNRLLREQLAAKDDRIAAKEAIIEIKDEQIKLLKSANSDRAGANTIDQYRIEACQAQLSKADAEIRRLRYPGLLERLFKPDTIIAGIVGYGFGKIDGK
jgi:multidrug resistance efflux pump